jgi:hypothetical protein
MPAQYLAPRSKHADLALRPSLRVALSSRFSARSVSFLVRRQPRRTSLRERVSVHDAQRIERLTPIVVLRTSCKVRANTDSGVAYVGFRNTSRSYARQNRPVRFAAKPAAQSWLINGRVRAICRHLRSRAERREQLAAVARRGTTYRRGRPTAAVRVSGLPVPKLPLSSAKITR